MIHVFHAIGYFFEAIFPALEFLGRKVNILFGLIGLFGICYWLFKGTTYKEPAK